jgi:hypothetical protein
MNTLKTLTAAAALMLTAIYSPTASQARWYIGHSDAETCVPIDDLDFNTGKRLYYGGGELKTPEAVAHWFSRNGFRMKRQSNYPEIMVVYQGSGPNISDTMFVFFEDKAICQKFMEMLDNAK